MELLLTLRNQDILEKIKESINGIIVGKYFTSGFDYSLQDLKLLRNYCLKNNLKYYIALDDFISEDDTILLYDYLAFIKKLGVDGIIFHDLGLFDAALKLNLSDILIYDGKSVLCNSLDTSFYLSTGIDSVIISPELTLQEIKKIVLSNPNKVSMQVFAHQRMSYSKRRFISNYLSEIGHEDNFDNKKSLYLIEEKRDYQMPILQDNQGTKIYTDYIFEAYEELPYLQQYLKMGIVDSLFIPDKVIQQVLRDYRRISEDNCHFLKESLKLNYPDNYSSGYLYRKTNISKDEQN